jgi:hypothetical protein
MSTTNGHSHPTNSSAGAVAFKDELAARYADVLSLLHLLSRSAQLAPSKLQQDLETLSEGSHRQLQEAVAALATQSSATQFEESMRLHLIDHLVSRFVLESYQKEQVPANSIRPILDHLVREIGAPQRKPDTDGNAQVQEGIPSNHVDLLERRFVAEAQAPRCGTLKPADAWCIPPSHLRRCAQESLRQGDSSLASLILGNYASGLRLEDPAARKGVAIGLAEMADLYATGDTSALELAIRLAGLQLSVERDTELQGLISTAFVGIAQEAFSRRHYRAVLQLLDSMDGVEIQRPVFAQSVWPRVDLKTHLHDFVDEAVHHVPNEPDNLMSVIERFPRPVAQLLTSRFNRSVERPECESVIWVARTAGAPVVNCLREDLRASPPAEAAEAVGLLSRLDAPTVKNSLGSRLGSWPRISQDRALRLLAAGGADDRGSLLLSILDQLDAMLKPLALDEIGMSGESMAAERLLRLAVGDSLDGCGDFVKLKAIEALGRLRASAAVDPLRHIVESKTLWHWSYPDELRLAAFQALREMAPAWAKEFFPHSGITAEDLKLTPERVSPGSPWIRQRRYRRVTLAAPLPATITSEHETIALAISGLSLSGGVSRSDKCLPSGTPVSIRLGPGLRPIRATAFLRSAYGQSLTFEFANMNLEERTKLRRLICENG